MSLLDKTDRIVDFLASLLVGPPHRALAKKGLYFLILATILYIPYCIVRHIHTSGFHVVSVERERVVGEEFAEQMERRMIFLSPEDPRLLYVDEIGRKIAEENNPWGADFVFQIFEDQRMVNAFAVPGGKIYITTGMLNKLDNEAELAAVLAHEVAHVSRRHYARNMGRQMLSSWAKKFLGGTDMTMLEMGSLLATNITLLGMRQQDELEADYEGALCIYQLDYDPVATVTMTRKLLDIEQKMPDVVKVFALTHPPSRERVEAMVTLKESLPGKDDLRLGEERYIEIINPQKSAQPHHPSVQGLPF
jgi:predicted Zn-dependent protease